MKKKLLVFGLVSILSVGLVTGCGCGKKKTKEENKDENKDIIVEKTYELEDVKYDTLDVYNITFETRESESVLRFLIKNNSEEDYPEGMINLDVMNGEEVLGNATTYITGIEAFGEISVEIVMNEVYSNVTDIKVNEQ